MLDHVRAHGVPGDPVLVDIVPQFVNWYLPGHPVALVPDAADRTARNAQHPMWNTPLQMPRWHIFFPLQPTGFWTCMGHCDVKVEPQHPGRPDSPYDLVSGRLGARARYCPVMGIPTSRLINAPYEYLATGITDPAGLPSTILVLAERCDAPGEKKTTP